jgi:hypothetical protein
MTTIQSKLKYAYILISLLLVLFTLLSGCEPALIYDNTSTHEIGQQQTEEVVKNLIENDELPQPKNALERENLKKRIEFMDQKDRIGYLYILTANGQLIREVQVLGKTTGLNTYLTPMEQIEWYEGVDLGEYYGDVAITTEAPDLDGTYGENMDGIFWFTPDDIYQELVGSSSAIVFYSSERLSFSTPPLLMEIQD